MARFTLSQYADTLKPEKIARKYQKIIEDNALELADALQRESPEGATSELKSGWDVQVEQGQGFGFASKVSITNSAGNAVFRIVGRGPGGFPPLDKIQAWADAVLGTGGFTNSRRIAYAIALGISRRGTRRWREQRNFAGLDRQGNPYKGGLIDTYRQRLLTRLKK